MELGTYGMSPLNSVRGAVTSWTRGRGSPDRGAPAGVPSSARGTRTTLTPGIRLGLPGVGRSDADSHGKTPDVPPSPPSVPVHAVTAYSVEPCAVPGDHPRPSPGAATVAACARPPRPSHTPCADVPPAQQPQPPTPAPVPDPTPSRCVLASVPLDQIDFFWRMSSADASANALSFRKISRSSWRMVSSRASLANVGRVSTCAMTSARQAVIWWEYKGLVKLS